MPFFSTSGTQDYLYRILQPPFVCHLDLWRRWYWSFTFQDAALDGYCRRKEKNQEERKYAWRRCCSFLFFFFCVLVFFGVFVAVCFLFLFCFVFFSWVDNFVLLRLVEAHSVKIFFTRLAYTSKHSDSQNSQGTKWFYGDPAKVLLI